MSPAAHVIIAPILIPLFAGALLVLLGERRPGLTIALSLGACLLHLVAVFLLAVFLDATAGTAVYALGDWAAPFGIVLTADRLSIVFLSLVSVIGAATFLFSITRWKQQGAYFAPLFQFLLMGLSGVFLTGDLFNLFVFFEVTLTASYGLALHGSGGARVIAGLHYIVVNLVASLLFLLGATLFFGVAGSLNFADLAQRIPQASDQASGLLAAGAALLAVAFLIKAAAWPMGMWLPDLYGAAAAPVSGVFVLLTKVGLYALLRLSALWSPEGALAAVAATAIGVMGVATLAVAMIGLLGTRSLDRMAGYGVIMSSGLVLAAFGAGGPAVLGGALFYLVVSSLAGCALFMLIGLIGAEPSRAGPRHAAVLEPYAPHREPRHAAPEAMRIVISRPAAFLGAVFLLCTLLLAGAPPFSGFIAKLAVLAPLVAGEGAASAGVAALIIAAGFATLAGLSRAGVAVFWADDEPHFRTLRWPEAVALLMVLGLALWLSFDPEPLLGYLAAAAGQLADPEGYVRAVLPGGTAP